MPRRLVAACALVCLLGAGSPASTAPKPPASWDGLSQVKAKRFDLAYLLPGADFRAYNKVMLDPTEVAFQRDWLRDHNATADFSNRLSDADARKMIEMVRAGFEETFRKTYTEAGYTVVSAPGPDVLRLRTAVVNLSVAAPDQSIGRSRTYARDAGGATVVVEARDSLSGALLGRAVDSRAAGDSGSYLRSSVSNRADFLQLFRTWAKASLDGLAELKSGSPPSVASK